MAQPIRLAHDSKPGRRTGEDGSDSHGGVADITALEGIALLGKSAIIYMYARELRHSGPVNKEAKDSEPGRRRGKDESVGQEGNRLPQEWPVM